MKPWVLYDHTDPVEDESQFPQTTIWSELELRDQLGELARSRPGTFVLKSPDGKFLELSIGGPWAALVWTKPPASNHNASAWSKTPPRVQPQPFRDQGMPAFHRLEDLHPVEAIVEAVVHFFNTHELAPWLQWRAWNPVSATWEIKPATSSPPRTAAVSQP